MSEEIFFKCFDCGEIVGYQREDGNVISQIEVKQHRRKYTRLMNEAITCACKRGPFVRVVRVADCIKCKELKNKPSAMDPDVYDLPGFHLGKI